MSTAIQPLPPEDANVFVLPMLTPTHAVDLFLGDLTRRSRSKSGRTPRDYRRILDKFTDQLGQIDVAEIGPDDCRRFLDQWAGKAAGTQATNHAIVNSFLEWLYQQQRIKRNPLDHVTRPRRIAADDLDVVSVSTFDVPRLLGACRTDSERLTIAILAYLGPRRNAVALLRLRDYDRDRGLIRFREKGSKVIWKPVPDELATVLQAAVARGVLTDADDYLVPPEGPLSRKGDRDDRVIWRLVKRVAARAGVEAHVHALRAAFATFYLEQPQNRNDLVGLQELMGHSSIETTRVYLRKLDKQKAMEPVRGLSWAGVGEDNMVDELVSQIAAKRFGDSQLVGAGGFEPPSAESLGPERAGSEPERLAAGGGPE